MEPTPQAEGAPLIGCLRCRIQYTWPKMRRAVETGIRRTCCARRDDGRPYHSG